MLFRPPLNHVMIYIFKFIVWCGNQFGRWSFDLYISSNENDLCHSARVTFPGNIKGLVNTLSISFFDWHQQQTDHEESAFNIWATVPLGDYSFIIYSFLLDQLDLESSGWMPNSCSDSSNSFLLFVLLS